MNERSATIETLEHHYMRAWIGEDARSLKKLTSGRFRLVVGCKPCVILDAPSWLHAAKGSYSCESYRFGDIYIHDVGSTAIFATQMEAEMRVGELAWSGQVWLSDVWQRGRFRRAWRIVDRSISRLDGSADLREAVHALQLWGRKRPARFRGGVQESRVVNAPVGLLGRHSGVVQLG